MSETGEISRHLAVVRTASAVRNASEGDVVVVAGPVQPLAPLAIEATGSRVNLWADAGLPAFSEDDVPDVLYMCSQDIPFYIWKDGVDRLTEAECALILQIDKTPVARHIVKFPGFDQVAPGVYVLQCRMHSHRDQATVCEPKTAMPSLLMEALEQVWPEIGALYRTEFDRVRTKRMAEYLGHLN